MPASAVLQTITASMSLRHLAALASLALVACAKPDGSAPAGGATPPPSFDMNRVDQARQMGSLTAKVWFIEGSDFECPYCKAFRDETWPKIEQEYVKTGKIRVAFMNHPMNLRPPFNMHPRSVPAAEVAMCAGAQDRFWQMHDSLFATQDKWARAADPQPIFDSLATALGLEMTSWRNCLTTHATRAMIEQDFQRTTAAGIEGTPGFVIGDTLAVLGAQPYADFKRAIDAALARTP
jgi:protein-disulfide isomerase